MVERAADIADAMELHVKKMTANGSRRHVRLVDSVYCNIGIIF